MKSFRLLVVRLSLLATLVLGAGAFLLDPVLAQGLVLGGLVRIAGFWIVARDIEFANVSSNRLKFLTHTGFAVRILIYALVLVKAYYLDTEHLYGFFGAAAGLLIVRVILALVVITGWDVKKTS